MGKGYDDTVFLELNLNDLELGKGFLETIKKVPGIKENKSKMYLIKWKCVLQNGTIKKVWDKAWNVCKAWIQYSIYPEHIKDSSA